jgi:cob(I)alamin adenosyltransferase
VTSKRSIATRTGDDGTTGFIYGQRVPKDHPQIEAIGAYDELNAAIGVAKSVAPHDPARASLELIQHELIALMGELAVAEADADRYAKSKFAKITDVSLARLDGLIGEIESHSLKFDGWATPGANPFAAALDQARTVARKAERRLVALPSHGRSVRTVVRHYANRIADLLWLLARQAENEPKG